VAQLVAIERYQVITQDEPDQGILIGQLDYGRQFSVLSCRRDPSGNDRLEIAVSLVVADDGPMAWLRVKPRNPRWPRCGARLPQRLTCTRGVHDLTDALRHQRRVLEVNSVAARGGD
jgi:hypothetical protein